MARCPEAKMPAGCRGDAVGQKARKVKGDVGVVGPPLQGRAGQVSRKGRVAERKKRSFPDRESNPGRGGESAES